MEVARVEVIVVGASYAGLACAAQIPSDRRVLLLERHESITRKHRGCLGLLIPIGDEVEISDNDLYFHDLDLLVEQGVRQRLNRLEIRGTKERVDFHLRKPLVLLNEERIKGALLKRIKEKSLEPLLGNAVREIHSDGREIKVRTDQEYRCRVLVGADGAASIVARSLHLKRDQTPILFQREAQLNHLDIPKETLHLQIDDARNLFFAFSQGDAYAASVVQLVAPRGVQDDLDRRLNDKVERLGASRIFSTHGAMVRLQRQSPVSYVGNVLLCGDAAASYGFSTITGALTMGLAAGRAINRYLAGSHYAFPDYHKQWRKKTHQAWLERIHWTFPLFSRIQGEKIDRLLRALKGSGNGSTTINTLLWRLPVFLYQLMT